MKQKGGTTSPLLNLDLTNVFYLLFRLFPIILPSYFVLSSIFSMDMVCSFLGLVRGDEDVFFFGEVKRCVGAEFPTESGLLEPAERSVVANRGVRVDRQVPALDGTGHADGTPHIPSPNRTREPEFGGVRNLDRVRLVLKGVNRDNRPENLVRHAGVF